MIVSWNRQIFADTAGAFIEENNLQKQFAQTFADEIQTFREEDSADERNLSREMFVKEYLEEIIDFLDNPYEVIDIMADFIKKPSEGTHIFYDEDREQYTIDFFSVTPNEKAEVLHMYATVMKQAKDLNISETEMKKFLLQESLK